MLTVTMAQVKKQVREQVLKDLDIYFEEAAEAEDEVTTNDPDIETRREDFYLYMYNVLRIGGNIDR